MSEPTPPPRAPRVEILRLAPAWDGPRGRERCERLASDPGALAAGTVLWADRNQLYRIRLDGEPGGEVVVKRFPIRALVPRLVYLMRSSKAARSFDNAVRLAALGVGTPAPLAAWQVRAGGLPAVAFYCCAYLEHWMLARDLKFEGAPATPELLAAIGGFVARLHRLGVLHHDLTAGNILMVRDGTEPAGVSFHLIDLNRLAFRRVGLASGLANLAQLGNFQFEDALVEGYCRGRGVTVARARPLFRALLGMRTLRWKIKNGTRPLRRKLGL